MNTLKISGRTSLLREIVTAILVVAGMSLVGMSVADEPVTYPFLGKAVLCFVDLSDEQPVGKGKGKTLTSGVYVWRLVEFADDPESADEPLMTGWQYNEEDQLLSKNKGTISGDLFMYPDVTHNGSVYTGRFVEEGYSFK